MTERRSSARARARRVAAWALCVGAGASGTALAGRPAPAAYVPGQLLVRFNRPATNADVSSLLAERGYRVLRDFRRSGVTLVGVGGDVQAAAAGLAQSPLVAYAEPNYLQYAAATPNDPSYPQLWGMNNTGQTGGTPDADIDAPEAWDIETGNGSVLVAVIDTGIDVDHPDLVGNLWTNAAEAAGTAGVDDDGNGYVDDVHGINAITGTGNPDDDNGHGTHCSGTIGAVGNNGVGVVGVNWDVQLMGCKFLSAAGSGSTDDAIECVEYTTAMGAAFTSNSWGGGGYSQALKDAIDAADAAGILFIAAAGNHGGDNDVGPFYPATYTSDNIISVAATDHNDTRAGFSAYGATTVDVAAPGVNILSTWPGGGLNTLSGTSMATPHVSGLAALLRSHYPALSHDDVKTTILETVDPLGLPILTGGRINAQAALLGVCDPRPVADAGADQVVCPSGSVTIGTPATPDNTYLWSPGGETTAQITVSPTETTTYTVTATTSCGSRQDSVTVAVIDSVGLDEDFEGGLGGWTASGLWHAATSSTCAAPEPGYSSPVTSAYFGQESTCNYDVGVASGSLTSGPIFGIDAASTLSFDYLREVESFAGNYDVASVEVLANGIATTVFQQTSSTPSNPVWTASGAISLGAFAGQAIQLRFTFNSGDSVSNAFTGWMVDDVVVTGSDVCAEVCQDGDGDGYGSPASESCTFPEADCDDGNASVNPGAAEVCNSADDDCDAVVDDGFDADGDTYTTCGGDCDDANGAVNPGASERPLNGIDDDCNPSTPANPACQSVVPGAAAATDAAAGGSAALAAQAFATALTPALGLLLVSRRLRSRRRQA